MERKEQELEDLIKSTSELYNIDFSEPTEAKIGDYILRTWDDGDEDLFRIKGINPINNYMIIDTSTPYYRNYISLNTKYMNNTYPFSTVLNIVTHSNVFYKDRIISETEALYYIENKYRK